MRTNKNQRKVKIIAEVHPQFMGSMNELERMIIQCKANGADYVKVQLYNSKKLFNNKDREFLEISKKEFFKISDYSKKIGIKLFASLFDEEKIDWCEEAGVDIYKIASRTVVDDIKLCQKIINTKKKVIISLGMYDFKKKPLPFTNDNIIYLYCVSKYPTQLTDIDMPDFENSLFSGFSDHTIGIAACLYAVSRGAEYIEKHYSNNSSMNVSTQQAHTCSMNEKELNLLRNLADSLTVLRGESNE
jgi:sialic acid synthase SpsE